MTAICPNCGLRAQMIERHSIAREPHGEVHEDSWLECSRCRAHTDQEELDRCNLHTVDSR